MNLSHRLILASNSPRRQQLLKEAGFTFEVYTEHVDESYPITIPPGKVAEFLSRKKNDFYRSKFADAIILTADTTVVLDNALLEKPLDASHAFEMLTKLSGRQHDVITGVSISYKDYIESFSVVTGVTFKSLSEEEINYYVSTYKPFDKAGSYGIQEWIGMIGIKKIAGSYFNVVGLPIQEVYSHLLAYKA